MCIWTPEQLAWEALEDCEKFLAEGKLRNATRATHDAMHCSLLLLLFRKGREHSPYRKAAKLSAFIASQPAEGAIKIDDPTLLKVLSTECLLKEASNLSFPDKPNFDGAAKTLIELRHQIEHPRPGVTAWDVLFCRGAIRGGIAVATWALQQGDCTYGVGLDLLTNRIRRHFPEGSAT